MKKKRIIFLIYILFGFLFFLYKGENMLQFYITSNFSYEFIYSSNTFQITFTYVISYAFFKVFLKLKGVNPTFKKFLFFQDSYFVKQRGRNYFCLNYFQTYVFHLHTLSKGNQLFLKVFVL